MISEENNDKMPKEELYTRLSQGDEQAYYEIFDLHWERLYTIAKKILREKESAKDVVQEIFLRLWEKRKESKIENLEHYLSRATKFAALNVIRNDHFKHSEELIPELIQTTGHSEIEYHEMEAEVIAAVDNLPERCREVFLLSRENNLSNAEIAKKLDLSQRTVETHISNALKLLRQKLPKDSSIALLLSFFI